MGSAPARRRRAFIAIVTVLMALSIWLWFSLPKPSREIQMLTGEAAASFPLSLAGAFHVHTNRSDGGSSPNDIARAASEAGLRFLVFTDHGDGTRVPDPPQYRSGVLTFDGVEISTNGGQERVWRGVTTAYQLTAWNGLMRIVNGEMNQRYA